MSSTEPRSTEPAGLDRRLNRNAGLLVGSVVILFAVLGFVVLPIVQGSAAGLDAWTAICRALGIQPGTPAVPVPETTATAQPVSQVAWTPALINQLGSGTPAAGAAVAENCVGCHGDLQNPQADPTFPKLAGQSALAIYKQMHDFRSGSRPSDVMTPIVETLDDQMILDVSVYYASLAKGTLDPNVAVIDDAATAELINRGSPARGIPACVACHGSRAGGPIETPTLAGQNAAYLAAQLRAYADGSRQNDVYSRMRSIARALTPEEIDRLSAYYSGVAAVPAN